MNPNIFVEIPEVVLERIKRTIARSNKEEGGKFIGRITQDVDGIRIYVEGYIDSGIKVDNSSSHLFPDGEYQELIYYLIENSPYNVELIGSWHSHHCNGLRTLSNGDIKGYINNVNSRYYNLDFFFVLLITDIIEDSIKMKQYLFIKDEGYVELENSCMQITQNKPNIEAFLRSAEDYFVLPYRDQARNEALISTKEDDYARANRPGYLKDIRAKDNQWLSQTYQNVKSKYEKRKDIICWEWKVPLRGDELEVRYQHPSLKESRQEVATIHINFKKEVFNKVIPLDKARFETILSFIEYVKEVILKRYFNLKET